MRAHFFIQRLKPFTSYQFRVKATNDIGDSEYSEESEAITTLQDGEESWKFFCLFLSPTAEGPKVFVLFCVRMFVCAVSEISRGLLNRF